MKPEFLSKEGYVVCRLDGRQSFKTMQAAYRSLIDDPRYHTSMHRIWVLNEKATIRDMTPEELTQLVHVSRQDGPASRVKVASVVTNDIDYGLCRMAHSLSDKSRSVDYMVFRTLPDAIAWINSP